MRVILRRATSGSDFADFLRRKSERTNVLWTGHARPPERDRLSSWCEEALTRLVILIAEDKGGVIGYAYLIPGGETIEAAVAVSQAVSGQGYGRRIVAQAGPVRSIPGNQS
jgi:hypothetical protein